MFWTDNLSSRKVSERTTWSRAPTFSCGPVRVRESLPSLWVVACLCVNCRWSPWKSELPGWTRCCGAAFGGGLSRAEVGHRSARRNSSVFTEDVTKTLGGESMCDQNNNRHKPGACPGLSHLSCRWPVIRSTLYFSLPLFPLSTDPNLCSPEIVLDLLIRPPVCLLSLTSSPDNIQHQTSRWKLLQL